MRIVIIEDEPFASEKLERYLLKHDTNIEVSHKLASVKEAVNWINLNQANVDCH